MPHHSLEVFHKFFDHPNAESGEVKRWTDGWLFVIEASIVYPKSINSGGGGGFFVYFLSFSSLFYYYSEDLRTHARKKGKRGDGKMKWKLTQRVTVFSFLFFPRSLFGCYLLSPFFILSSSGLLKCFIFFTLSSNSVSVFLLLLFIQTISIILVGFLYFIFSLFFVPFVLSPSPDSSLPLCNRFSYTPPTPALWCCSIYLHIKRALT